jgi:hypothetical protein
MSALPPPGLDPESIPDDSVIITEGPEAGGAADIFPVFLSPSGDFRLSCEFASKDAAREE